MRRAAALANGGNGITISGGASGNTIGGTTAGAGNLISGNAGYGIDITGSGTNGNFVQGNFIGANLAGTAALPNGSGGVFIDNGASGNTIGGSTTSASSVIAPGVGSLFGLTSDFAGNLISGNMGDGVSIGASASPATQQNTVEGNFIGTTVSGAAALPYQHNGVEISNEPNNTIGPGTASGSGNLISGNMLDGITISGSNASGNAVEGDYVGVKLNGTQALANSGAFDLDAEGFSGLLTVLNTLLGGAFNFGATAGTLNVSGLSASIIAANATGITASGALTSTTGAVSFTGPVSLSADTTVTSATTATFNGTVNGAHKLTVAAAGATTFQGAIGGNVPLTQITTSAASPTNLDANLNAAGNLIFNAPLTLGANTSINAGAGNVTFASTIDGQYALTVNTTGNALFEGAIGGNATLTQLTISAAGQINLNGNVTAMGNVAFNGPLVLGANTVINAGNNGNVTFANTVDGPFALTVNSTGNTLFQGTVGSGAPLLSLTTDAPGFTILGASITTVGNLTINDPVTLTASVTLIDAAASGTGIFLFSLDSALTPAPTLTAETDTAAEPNARVRQLRLNHQLVRHLEPGDAYRVVDHGHAGHQLGQRQQRGGPRHGDGGDQHQLPECARDRHRDGVGGHLERLVDRRFQHGELQPDTTIDLSQDTTPVTITVAATPNPIVVMGDPTSNTFTMAGNQENDVTFIGSVGLNNFAPDPANGFNVTLVDPPAATNTIDLSQAFLPTSVAARAAGGAKQIGATIDLTQNNGQKQSIYNSAVTDPDIGSLLDPSELTSNSGDTVSLEGTFPKVILGSGATLFAAPATYDSTGATVPGTDVVVMGTGNTVYGSPGATIDAPAGGNNVIQNFDQTQANAYLAAGAQTYYAANVTAMTSLTNIFNSSSPQSQQAQQALLSDPATLQAIVSSPSTLQAVAQIPGAFQQLFSNSAALESLTSSPAAMNAITNNEAALQVITQTPAALAAIITDPTALNIVTNSQAALVAIADSPTALSVIGSDPAALEALTNNAAALASITSSPLSLEAVASSPTALAVISKSPAALTAIVNDPTALVIISKSPAAPLEKWWPAARRRWRPSATARRRWKPSPTARRRSRPSASTPRPALQAIAGDPAALTLLTQPYRLERRPRRPRGAPRPHHYPGRSRRHRQQRDRLDNDLQQSHRLDRPDGQSDGPQRHLQKPDRFASDYQKLRSAGGHRRQHDGARSHRRRSNRTGNRHRQLGGAVADHPKPDGLERLARQSNRPGGNRRQRHRPDDHRRQPDSVDVNRRQSHGPGDDHE